MSAEDAFLDALSEPFKTQAWNLLTERARDVDAFIAISNYYGTRMSERLKLPPQQLRTVPNGILLDGYPTSPVPAPASQTIGFLARLHPGKGLKTLVQAFILLRQNGRHPQLKLHIAGSQTPADLPFIDELRGLLQKASLQSEVIISPNIDRAEKIAFLQSLTVFSVPATYGEAFGLYVLEALAAGIPVVQPNHAAFPELIEATGGGLLCKPDDPQDLADQLEKLLDDPVRARKLGEAGRLAVREQFSVERMTGGVLDVFESIRLPTVGQAGQAGQTR